MKRLRVYGEKDFPVASDEREFFALDFGERRIRVSDASKGNREVVLGEQFFPFGNELDDFSIVSI